jgi:hypothetical protein
MRSGLALPGLFIAVTTAYVLTSNLSRPRVFVLHSGEAREPFTAEVDDALRRVLGRRGDVIKRFAYMGATRRPRADACADQARFRALVEAYQPRVLVAVGDEAQRCVAAEVAREGRSFVVFAATHDPIASYAYERAARVTGIMGRPPLDLVREALVHDAAVHGRSVRLVTLGDESAATFEDETSIESFAWEPLRLGKSVRVSDLVAWRAVVENAAHYGNVLLLLHHGAIARAPGDPATLPESEVLRWTIERSPIPVVVLGQPRPGDEVPLAIAASPREQGEVAGRLAVALVDGEPAPAPITPHEAVVTASASRLARAGLVLSPSIEALARADRRYTP